MYLKPLQHMTMQSKAEQNNVTISVYLKLLTHLSCNIT